MNGGGANLPPFSFLVASTVMTDEDDWSWRAYLTDAEDAALQAGDLTPRDRWRIAREIAHDTGTNAEQILAAMRPSEDAVIDQAIALINKTLAEPAPVVRKPEATYRRDGAGHRRPLRARR